MTAALGPLDPATLGAALAVGLGLGVAYFGGLWWTLARLGVWRRPGPALAVSFALRGALALVVFALLARTGLAPLAVAFAGFVASHRLGLGGARGGAGGGAPGSVPGGARGREPADRRGGRA